MVSVIASSQQQIENAVRDGIGDVRERIASECEKTNETTLVSEIRDVKKTVEFSCEDGNETRLAEVEKEIKEEISGVKNETNRVLDVLENVVNAIKTIASNQQKTADELREMKRLLESKQSACECVNSTCPSPAEPVVVVSSTDYITMPTTVSPPESPSKQALVSALVCEYQRLLSVKNNCADSTHSV